MTTCEISQRAVTLPPLPPKKIPGFAQILWVVLLEAGGSGPLDPPASAAPATNMRFHNNLQQVSYVMNVSFEIQSSHE